jgi:hypothetical protein
VADPGLLKEGRLLPRVAVTKGGCYQGWLLPKVVVTKGGCYQVWLLPREVVTKGGCYQGWPLPRVPTNDILLSPGDPENVCNFRLKW